MDQPPPTTAPQSTEPPPATASATTAAGVPPRPSFNTRPWQPSQPFTSSPFSLPSSPLPPSSTSATPAPGGGGLAIGVPSQSPSPAAFASLASPAYAQQPPQPAVSMGPHGSTASLRPGGVSANQLRPSLRPQTSTSGQSPMSQNFQGHNMHRTSSLGSPISPSPSISQAPQTQNQPWLSSTNQAKPPLPSPSFRPQTTPQTFQQRSHIPQPHQSTTPNIQQQQQTTSSSQQQLSQSSASGQTQDHYSRNQQPLSQQQMTRGPGLGSQRPPIGTVQPSASLPLAPTKAALVDNEETTNRIIGKRTIQELVNQIDPSEKIHPQVEDILLEIAEDFVESITSFGCSLAKHRKSTTLEAKDILLHLERNWNMTLPGFGGDDIRTYKKPVVSDIHRERLAAIKKSNLNSDSTTKISGGTSGANVRGQVTKGPANAIGSPPNTRIRESA